MVLNYILVWYPVHGPWSWVVWGQKMCSDLKSPMLQVLSNTSLKVFLSTTPNFCLGALRTPPPVPPETLLFGLLLGCLHYYKCRHCKIWRNFWVPSPFKPNIFFFFSPLNPFFFPGPPQSPPPPPPPPHYLIILERSLRRFFLLIRYCIYETKL